MCVLCVHVFMFGRVTLKYFFPTYFSLIPQTHSLPPQVQSRALARTLLRLPSAILSFSRQHSSNLIDHNMAPSFSVVSAILEIPHRPPRLSLPQFYKAPVLHCLETQASGEKKNPKKLVLFSPPQFPILLSSLPFFIISFFLPSSSTQPLYSPPCHAAIISQR